MRHIKRKHWINKFAISFLCLLLSVLLVVTLMPSGGFAFAADKFQDTLSSNNEEVDFAEPATTYTINFISDDVVLDTKTMEFTEGESCQLERISYNNQSLIFSGWSLDENNTDCLIADGAVIDEDTQVLANCNGEQSLINLSEFASESATISMFAHFTKQEPPVNSNATMNKGPISEGLSWDDGYVDMPQASDDTGSRILTSKDTSKTILDASALGEVQEPFSDVDLSWIKINDESVGKQKEITDVPEDNVKQRLQFQLDFSFLKDTILGKESIQITLDAQYWTDRAANKTGTLSLGVPEYPSTAAAFAYTYCPQNNTYILTNTQEVKGNVVYSIQFSINDIMPQTIKDMSSIEFSINLQAGYQGKNVSVSSPSIKATMDTYERLTEVKCNAGNDGLVFKSWTDAMKYGCRYPKPENESDYIYVEWYTSASFTGCKNFTLSLETKIEDKYPGAFIFGASDDGFGTFSFTVIDKSYQRSGMEPGISIWAAYPVSAFVNERQTYDLTLKVDWKLEETNDGVTPDKYDDNASSIVHFVAPQSFTVSIQWDDNDNKEGKRPASKDIYIYCDYADNNYGVFTKATLSADSDTPWSTTLYNLDGTYRLFVSDSISSIPNDPFYTYDVYRSWNNNAIVKGIFIDPEFSAPANYQYISDNYYCSNRNHSEYYDRHDSDLYKLVTGDSAKDIVLTENLYSFGMRSTLGDSLYEHDINNFGKKAYTVYQSFDSFKFQGVEGGGILGVGDYAIRSLNIDKISFQKMEKLPGCDASVVDVSQKDSDHLPVYIYAKSFSEDQSSLYATGVWDEVKGCYVFQPIKGCTISKENIIFDEDVAIESAYFQASTTFASINTKVSATIELMSSEAIQNSVKSYLLENQSGKMEMETNIAYNMLDEAGKTLLNNNVAITTWHHGYMPLQASKLTTQITQSEADQDKNVIPIHFQQNFYAQSNIENYDDYLYCMESGFIPNMTIDINTFYTLIPIGVVVDTSSIICPTGGIVISVDYIDNFRNSGRTLLIVKTKNDLSASYKDSIESPVCWMSGYLNTMTIKFDGTYSFFDRAAYSDELISNSAFESGTSWIGNVEDYIGEPDNPTFGNHKDSLSATEGVTDIMTGLDENHLEGDNNFVYAKGSHTTRADLNFSSGFSKSCVADGEYEYSLDKTVVHEGQGYNYRLQYGISTYEGQNQSANDLVIIDSLETASPSSWHGVLNYIDINKLYAAGVEPVVYATTSDTYDPKSGLFKVYAGNYVDENNKTDGESGFLGKYAFADGTSWVPLSDFTDYSNITAIAVDCTHTSIVDGKYAENSKFYLESEGRNEIGIDIHMYAPEGNDVNPDTTYQGDGYDASVNQHVYNNAFLNVGVNNQMGRSSYFNSEAITQNTPTSVGIQKMDSYVNIVVNDGNNRDGLRPADVDVALKNSEGTEIARQKVEFNDNMNIVYQGVSSWHKGKIEKYLIEQIPDESHPTFSSDYTTFQTTAISPSDGSVSYSIYDTHNPVLGSVSGSIFWENENDDLSRPDFYDLSLVDRNGDVVQTITIGKDESSYTFDKVYRYENGGQDSVYSLAVTIDDYLTTFENKGWNNDILTIDVTNSYYPYGDICVLENNYIDSTPLASVKKFTFNITLSKDEKTVSQLFKYTIYNSDGSVSETGDYSSGQSFELGQGQYLIVKDLPTHSWYDVYQELLPGFTQDEMTDVYGQVSTNLKPTAKFTNRYRSSIDFSPLITTKVTGHALSSAQFQYNLGIVDGLNTKIIRSAANGKPLSDEENSAYVNFSTINYTNKDLEADGTCSYTFVVSQLTEKNPGYSCTSTNPVQFDVIFSDDGEGNIVCTGNNPITFENVYSASGSYSPKAWVDLTDGTLKDNQFSFKLQKLMLSDDSYVVDSSFSPVYSYNVADGTIDFINSDKTPAITFNNNDIDKAYYFVINQNTPEDDYAYEWDNSVKGFKISITDNNDGTLSLDTKNVIVTYSDPYYTIDEDSDAPLPVFNNKCKPGTLEINDLWADGANRGPNPYINREYRVVLSGGSDLPDSFNYRIENAESTVSSLANESEESINFAVTEEDEGPNVLDETLNNINEGFQAITEETTKLFGNFYDKFVSMLSANNDENLGATPDHIKVEATREGVVTFTGVTGEVTDSFGDYRSWPWVFDFTHAYNYGDTTRPVWLNGLQGFSLTFNIESSCTNVPITDAHGLFYFNTTVAINGLSNLNTSQCTNMENMFSICPLTSLDLSGFNTSNVSNMKKMFFNCPNITSLDISSFNTSNLEDATSMFDYCLSLQNIKFPTNFVTTKIKTMEQMFYGCESLQSVDFSSKNLSSCINFKKMFYGCYGLKSVKFDSSTFNNSTASDGMFNSCSSLTYLDISNFNFEIGEHFIYQCSGLKTIKLGSCNTINMNWSLPKPPKTKDGITYSENWCMVNNPSIYQKYTTLSSLFNSNPSMYAGEWTWQEYVATEYTVNYNANSGGGSMASSVFTSDEAHTLPACSFYKFNATFKGWSLSNTSTEIKYADKATIPANTYEPDAVVNLFAVWESGSSEGTVTGHDFNLIIPACGKAIFENIPSGTSYFIYQKDKEGYKLVSSSDVEGVIGFREVDTSNSLTAESYTGVSSAQFYNKFTGEAPASTIDVNVKGKVTYDGNPADAGKFKFNSEMTASESNPVVNAANGIIDFGTVTLSAAGEYTYKVKQVFDEEDTSIIYDDTEYDIVINVTNTAGVLDASFEIKSNGVHKDIALFNNVTAPGSLEFSNIISVGSSVSDPNFNYELILTGSLAKDITKISGTKTHDEVDSPVDINIENGKGSFVLKSNDKIVLKDIPSGIGYQISDKNMPIGWTQTATSNLSGNIVAGSVSSASATYTYGAASSIDLQAWVYLKGAAIAEGQFAFDLQDASDNSLLPKDEDGNPVYVANGARDNRKEVNGVANEHYFAAPIDFNGIIKISAEGTTDYKIVQANKTNPNISYDESAVTVSITATDRGDGTFDSSISINYGDDDKVFITNKVLTGTMYFNAVLDQTTANPTASSEKLNYKFEFYDGNGIELDGDYNTYIGEDRTAGLIKSGDTYSLAHAGCLEIAMPYGSSWKIYSVEENPAFSVVSYDGVAVANKASSQGTITSITDTFEGSCTQSYSAFGAVLPIGKVFYDGGFLKDSNFNFNIRSLDTGKSSTVTNSSTGDILFNNINFNATDAGTADEPKVYKYEISQNCPESNFITYDQSVYTAYVTVSDNDASGLLTCSINYFDSEGASKDTVSFTNTLRIPNLPQTGMTGILVTSIISLTLLAFFLYRLRRNSR